MSNTDSFIEEVTEEVRRDRLFALFRRYGWIGAVLVLAIVGGTAWTQYAQSRAAAEAEARGDALLTALQAPGDAERAAALEAVAVDGPAAAIAGFLTADAQLTAGEAAAAVATLEAVADDPEVEPIYRELAQLKALLADTGRPAAERAAALEPLGQPGAPFRLVALEAQALAQVEAGDTDAALATLQALIEDASVTGGLRERASTLIVALGGTPGGSAAAGE